MKRFFIKYRGDGVVREDIWYAGSQREAKRCANDEYRQTYTDYRFLSINEIKQL